MENEFPYVQDKLYNYNPFSSSDVFSGVMLWKAINDLGETKWFVTDDLSRQGSSFDNHKMAYDYFIYSSDLYQEDFKVLQGLMLEFPYVENSNYQYLDTSLSLCTDFDEPIWLVNDDYGTSSHNSHVGAYKEFLYRVRESRE